MQWVWMGMNHIAKKAQYKVFFVITIHLNVVWLVLLGICAMPRNRVYPTGNKGSNPFLCANACFLHGFVQFHQKKSCIWLVSCGRKAEYGAFFALFWVRFGYGMGMII